MEKLRQDAPLRTALKCSFWGHILSQRARRCTARTATSGFTTMLTSRQALARYAQFLMASPLLADRKHSELGDPLYSMANVFDFAKAAKAKLDPVAWDYM